MQFGTRVKAATSVAAALMLFGAASGCASKPSPEEQAMVQRVEAAASKAEMAANKAEAAARSAADAAQRAEAAAQKAEAIFQKHMRK